jgi:hypothetical protein
MTGGHMAFDWKSLIGTVAPTIATALGGPLAGMAVKAVGDALGVQNPTEDNVSAALANATPDVLLKVKQADQEFAEKMKQMDIDLEKIQADDRASARSMQVSTRSLAPQLLAGLITIGFFGILIGLMGGWLHTGDSNELLLLLGSLATSWGAVVNFYYGSSSQSHMQTRILGEHSGK